MGAKVYQLLNMKIWGNAYHDQKLFNLANQIIMAKESTMSQKKLALRKIDEAMGLDDPVNDEAVLSYVAGCEAMIELDKEGRL